MLNPQNWMGFEYRELPPRAQAEDEETAFEIWSYLPDSQPALVGKVSFRSQAETHLFIQSVCSAAQAFHRLRIPEQPLVSAPGRLPLMRH